MSSEYENKDEQKDVNQPSLSDSQSSSETQQKHEAQQHENYGKKIRDMLEIRQQIQQQQQ